MNTFWWPNSFMHNNCRGKFDVLMALSASSSCTDILSLLLKSRMISCFSTLYCHHCLRNVIWSSLVKTMWLSRHIWDGVKEAVVFLVISIHSIWCVITYVALIKVSSEESWFLGHPGSDYAYNWSLDHTTEIKVKVTLPAVLADLFEDAWFEQIQKYLL